MGYALGEDVAERAGQVKVGASLVVSAGGRSDFFEKCGMWGCGNGWVEGVGWEGECLEGGGMEGVVLGGGNEEGFGGGGWSEGAFRGSWRGAYGFWLWGGEGFWWCGVALSAAWDGGRWVLGELLPPSLAGVWRNICLTLDEKSPKGLCTYMGWVKG